MAAMDPAKKPSQSGAGADTGTVIFGPSKDKNPSGVARLALGYSVEYGIRAIWRARRMAVRTLRWHGAQVPNIRLGRILARSGMKASRSFVFL